MISVLGVRQVTARDGRPRPADLVVTGPDGTRSGADLVMISPSALASYLRCPRKWGWAHLDGIRKPQKASQAHGSAVHGELEAWSLHGTPPTAPELVRTEALNDFPAPGTPGLGVEQIFALAVEDTVTWGFQDQTLRNHVWDLKTTADLCWAKSEDDLRCDPQGVLYGCEAAARTGLPVAHLHWVYVTTRRPYQKRAVIAHVLAAAAQAQLYEWLPTLRAMTSAKQAQKRAIECEPNNDACGDYGGCEYLAECSQTAARPRVFLAHMRQLHEEMTRRSTT